MTVVCDLELRFYQTSDYYFCHYGMAEKKMLQSSAEGRERKRKIQLYLDQNKYHRSKPTFAKGSKACLLA